MSERGPDWDRVRRTFDEAIAAASPWPGRPGEHRWIAHGLDPYHAVNLREALKLVPDTGDWHGSLRAACEIVLSRHEAEGYKPNQTAEQMQARLAASPPGADPAEELATELADGRHEANLLEKALAELVRLKDLKEAGDDLGWTEAEKAKAWQAARAALSEGTDQ